MPKKNSKRILVLAHTFSSNVSALGFQIPINRRHHHRRHRSVGNVSCGVFSAFCICVSYGGICHGVHSMNYNIHT